MLVEGHSWCLPRKWFIEDGTVFSRQGRRGLCGPKVVGYMVQFVEGERFVTFHDYHAPLGTCGCKQCMRGL